MLLFTPVKSGTLEQAKRLEALQEAAREQMAAKEQHRQQWQQRGRAVVE